MTKLLACSCDHPYQDRRYGKRVRLHNYAEKKQVWRCSVCKAEKAE